MKHTNEIEDGIRWAAAYVTDRANREPIEVEQMVEVHDKTGALLTFGYLDCAWRDEDGVMNLADLKTGGVREYKAQLTVYALGLMQRDGLEEVKCHEIFSEMKWAKTYTVTKNEAERLINKIVSMKRNPTKSPSCCEYCSWCKHQLHCTALNHTAMTVAERSEEVIEKYHPSAVTSPLLLARMLTVANALDSWIKAVKSKAKTMSELPGFKQIHRRGRPKVEDLASAFLATGMSADEFLSACSLSLDKLAKVVAEKEGVDVKAARNEIEKTLGDLVKAGPPIQYWSK